MALPEEVQFIWCLEITTTVIQYVLVHGSLGPDVAVAQQIWIARQLRTRFALNFQRRLLISCLCII